MTFDLGLYQVAKIWFCDQETGGSCDEQQKKAPSEMGKTGPGLKKKEEGESVRLSLPLARSKRCGQSGRRRTTGAIIVAHGIDDADDGGCVRRMRISLG